MNRYRFDAPRGALGAVSNFSTAKEGEDGKDDLIGEGTSEIQRMVIGGKLLQRHKI